MKKSVLFLLALSGCVRLNYVDIPADPSYKFRYVGEDAVVKCVDEKFAGRMCEKDGKTFANGSHVYEFGGKLAFFFYVDGKIVADEVNFINDVGGNGSEIIWLGGDNKHYHISYNFPVRNENEDIIATKSKVTRAKCGNGNAYGWAMGKNFEQEDKELQEFERLTGGTNSCDFLKEENIKQGNPEKKIIFKDAE